jgi:hypothetical protein
MKLPRVYSLNPYGRRALNACAFSGIRRANRITPTGGTTLMLKEFGQQTDG